ncbi:pre-mRNA-splicing factor cwc22 [Datura stramonium]|uniref:Pre-mRNA-splicing factor cwc22 n=1 Tax=Datura stramonium TaxID=4076 RepID=A0ABS8S3U3_DATST|nr:pre-mRNA-splicing factor cwc22 [Datura stramonium]
MELCIMLLSAAVERTYLHYYAPFGTAILHDQQSSPEEFQKSFTHALPWHVLAYLSLTEEDTTSSSRGITGKSREYLKNMPRLSWQSRLCEFRDQGSLLSHCKGRSWNFSVLMETICPLLSPEFKE